MSCECGRTELDDLVASMCVNGKYISACPLCALRIRNEIHGMGTEPFQGEIAREMFLKAFDKAKTKTDFEILVRERM